MENDYHYNIVAAAIRFLRENYRDQPDLDQIASHVNLSPFHFQRIFREWSGVSPKKFLQYITIENAKKYLLEGSSTLETAYSVGLSGNGRLHDLFVKIESVTPGEFKRGGENLRILTSETKSPFGNVFIAETHAGICRLSFTDLQTDETQNLRKDYPKSRIIEGIGPNGKLVSEYFNTWKQPGKKIILDLKGTPFQFQVWRALLTIPSSNLVTYGAIAEKIGNPGASRAVGSAIGSNPVAYLIPCHRVIRQNGETGGYRWGSERKMALIGYESSRWKNP